MAYSAFLCSGGLIGLINYLDSAIEIVNPGDTTAGPVQQLIQSSKLLTNGLRSTHIEWTNYIACCVPAHSSNLEDSHISLSLHSLHRHSFARHVTS